MDRQKPPDEGKVPIAWTKMHVLVGRRLSKQRIMTPQQKLRSSIGVAGLSASPTSIPNFQFIMRMELPKLLLWSRRHASAPGR